MFSVGDFSTENKRVAEMRVSSLLLPNSPTRWSHILWGAAVRGGRRPLHNYTCSCITATRGKKQQELEKCFPQEMSSFNTIPVSLLLPFTCLPPSPTTSFNHLLGHWRSSINREWITSFWNINWITFHSWWNLFVPSSYLPEGPLPVKLTVVTVSRER